jgi:ubiquinone/menaquinone biosynthesis C-methylase UbiE
MFAASASLRIPFDPVTLSYVLALRGVRPRLPNETFTYAELGCGSAERLMLLAACNPEGTFFGFDPSIELLNKAAATAEAYGITNLTFAQASARALKDAVDGGVIKGKSFDYLVFNEIGNPAAEDVAALNECARVLLGDNGIFAYRYRIYDEVNADELLFQSLTQQMLADPGNTSEDFAKEWRALCQLYFSAYPQQSDAFDAALRDGKGMNWLKEKAGSSTKPSKALSVAQAFSGRDMTFLGSGTITNNYMELSVPEAAHLALAARRQLPVYEALKDLAMHNVERIDIWGREPLQRLDNLVTLFGGFTFGATETPERIARTMTFQGKSISFVGPLYDSILSLATVMPVTIGDLVHHESLAGVDAVTILNTIQLLVACNVLQPMRSSFGGGIDMDNPKLVGTYNESLRKAQLDFQDYVFASTVVGRPITFSGMNALVLQALDKGGTSNIGMLLSDELIRLSQHPYLRPLNLNQPERAVDEAVRQIENVFHQSMVRWFSLGIINNQN